MNSRFTVLFLAMAFAFSIVPSISTQAASPGDEPRVATGVELERYLGKWYDVRSIPNDFQEGCTKTTAVYETESEGSIKVTNNCRIVDTDGMFQKDTSVVGRGWVKNAEHSILKVSFSCMFGACAESMASDSWILELGPLNSAGQYAWAIVGSPTREFGWVLSRTPTLDATTMLEIETLLRIQGYDPSAFRMTPQK